MADPISGVAGAIGGAISGLFGYLGMREQALAIKEQVLGQDRTNETTEVISGNAAVVSAKHSQALILVSCVVAGAALAIAYVVWSPHRLPVKSTKTGKFE